MSASIDGWVSTCCDAVARLRPETAREARLRAVVDALWPVLSGRDVSWLGFYIDQPNEPDDRRMVLGPCRDRPACSPIGVHGVCGQALVARRTQIVEDVRSLGDNYVACDPRDRSELVIPLFENASRALCWGVFDLDSPTPSRFTSADAEAVKQVLQAAAFITD